LSLVVAGCYSLALVVTRCRFFHLLSLVVARCRSLSLVVTGCHWLSLVVTGCRSLSLVVARCHSLSPVVCFSVTHYIFVKRECIQKPFRRIPRIQVKNLINRFVALVRSFFFSPKDIFMPLMSFGIRNPLENGIHNNKGWKLRQVV